MKLLQRSALLARPTGLGLQPASKFVGKRIKLARSFRYVNVGSIVPALKYFAIVLRDSPVRRLISRIDCFSRSAIRRMMFKSPMWITPLPRRSPRWGKVHMAQFSMEIMRLTGSVLRGNQHAFVFEPSMVACFGFMINHFSGEPVELCYVTSTSGRMLDPKFLDALEALATSSTENWRRDILGHRDLVLAVRRSSINAYYRGASVFRIEWKAGKISPVVHLKYLATYEQDYIRLNNDNSFELKGIEPLATRYEGRGTEPSRLCRRPQLVRSRVYDKPGGSH
jgi:hypothetical protein